MEQASARDLAGKASSWWTKEDVAVFRPFPLSCDRVHNANLSTYTTKTGRDSALPGYSEPDWPIDTGMLLIVGASSLGKFVPSQFGNPTIRSFL